MSFFGFIDINDINTEGLGIDTNNNIKGGNKKLQKIIKKRYDNNKNDNNSNESSNNNDIINNNVSRYNNDKKQEELKQSDILRDRSVQLSKDELYNYIKSYYDNYVKFIDIVNKEYNNIKLPSYISNEKIIEIKALHIVNDLKKINRMLNTPQINQDYSIIQEIKNKNRLLMANYPLLDDNTYKQIIANLSLLDIKEIIKLINKYGYNELFKIVKFKIPRLEVNIENKSKILCKRYWVNNMSQYKNLVYDKSIYTKNINKNNGIDINFINMTNSIVYENEDKITNELKRYINTDVNNKIDKFKNNKIDNYEIKDKTVNHANFVSAYNKYIENIINQKIVKCTTIPAKNIVNISDQLFNSINIDSIINNSSNKDELITKIIQNFRVFLVDALYNLNSSVKNKRELYFANAKIIFDIIKEIKTILKQELNSQDIVFPLDNFDKKTEAYGKIKLIINKCIDHSGVKRIGKTVEQTICI